MVKISFILPAYKRGYLKDAIASILAQTVRDFELVVVDDHSPEDLESVVREFSDPRLKYVKHEVNLGGKDLVAAWEYAMSFAKGEWCVLASDDDIYHPRYLEEMFRLTEKYPTCDLFHCRAAKIDGEGKWRTIGDPRIEFESQLAMAYFRGVRGLSQTAPDFMFRRSAYEALGGFVKFPLAWFSDDATWLELAKNGVACAQETLFYFRVSGVNISSRSDNIAEKIAAGEEFKLWFTELVETLEPQTEEERAMLPRLVGGMEERVDDLAREELASLTFGAWLKLVFSSRLPRALRGRAIKDRFPVLKALMEKKA